MVVGGWGESVVGGGSVGVGLWGQIEGEVGGMRGEGF